MKQLVLSVISVLSITGVSAQTNVQKVQSLLTEYASDCYETAGSITLYGLNKGWCKKAQAVGTAGFSAPGLNVGDEHYDANPILECAKRCNALGYGTGFYLETTNAASFGGTVYTGENGASEMLCSCATDSCAESLNSNYKTYMPFRRVANFDTCVNAPVCPSDQYMSSTGCQPCPDGLSPNSDQTMCLDVCGIPNGDGTSCRDLCWIPFGDNTACRDCNGTINGTLVVDACGWCGGDNSTMDDCGVCDGNNQDKDICGVCWGNGTSCYDVCGIPHGDGTSCHDRCGVPNGFDRCCYGITDIGVSKLDYGESILVSCPSGQVGVKNMSCSTSGVSEDSSGCMPSSMSDNHCLNTDCTNYGGHKNGTGPCYSLNGGCSPPICCMFRTQANFNSACSAYNTVDEYLDAGCCDRTDC